MLLAIATISAGSAPGHACIYPCLRQYNSSSIDDVGCDFFSDWAFGEERRCGTELTCDRAALALVSKLSTILAHSDLIRFAACSSHPTAPACVAAKFANGWRGNRTCKCDGSFCLDSVSDPQAHQARPINLLTSFRFFALAPKHIRTRVMG